MKAQLFADGGSRGNPGPAASGFVVYSETGEIVFERGDFLGNQTNNFAEYTGLINGMEKCLELGVTELEVRMDSELVVRQCLGVYKVRNAGLIPLSEKVRALKAKFDKVTFLHVRREYNKEADRMVNLALDREIN
jgi:ribonuclease HI